MDTEAFNTAFLAQCDRQYREHPNYEHWDPIERQNIDPFPTLQGMLSIKKQQLLNLAFKHLPEGEAYFEIGVYHGKSILSAMYMNPPRTAYACDNFSQFDDNALDILQENLRTNGKLEQVTFFDCDFVESLTQEKLREPIGLYFYDGAHDEESQFNGIHLVEEFLADEALVFVDDWRFAQDSQSFAEEGTLRAITASQNQWKLHHALPARFNGDMAMWWNGVAVLSFNRLV